MLMTNVSVAAGVTVTETVFVTGGWVVVTMSVTTPLLPVRVTVVTWPAAPGGRCQYPASHHIEPIVEALLTCAGGGVHGHQVGRSVDVAKRRSAREEIVTGLDGRVLPGRDDAPVGKEREEECACCLHLEKTVGLHAL